MVNRFRDSFLRKTFLFLTANDAGRRGSGSHTSMTEHVTHRVAQTLTFAFIPSALPVLFLVLCVSLSVRPFRNLLGREVRKWGEKKQNKTVTLLFRISPSLRLSRSRSSLSPSLRLLPCSSQWDVLTLCKGCACSFSIQSAKPIDPLTTCCSPSFREEQVCTGERILMPKASTVKSHMGKVLTEVIPLISST